MSEDLTKKLPKSDGEKLTLILTTVQALSYRVSNLEETVTTRLYDTRPMWQKLVTDIEQLQEGQRQLQEGQRRLEEGHRRLEEGHRRLEEGHRRLEEGQEELRTDVREIKKTLRDVYHRFGVLNDTIITVQAQQRDIHERVSRLEADRHQPNSST